MDFLGGTVIKNLRASAGDVRDSILGWVRSPGRGHGNLLQYSCLENSMDREVWWAIVHGVTEADTTEWLSLHVLIKTKIVILRDFPDGPVVEVLPFNEERVGSIFCQRVKVPHASWPKNQNTKQKQYCNKFNKDFTRWSTSKESLK